MADKLEIISIDGRPISDYDITLNQNDVVISLPSTMNPGIYILKVEHSNSKQTFTFVKTAK